MAEIKLCKDCKWCKISGYGFSFAKCLAPQSKKETDLVSGRDLIRCCDLHRDFPKDDKDNPEYEICGSEGSWWEPKDKKENWWTRCLK